MKKLLAVTLLTASFGMAARIGPSKGSLVIVGGGNVTDEITSKFLSLAGGKDADIVIIPTADGQNKYDSNYLEKTFLRMAGATHLTILHTNDRAVADSKDFVVPLRHARAVWFVGGRQWRLSDAYLNTRTQKELFGVLKRGGVIGGSSAGATIIGSYMVRGAVAGNEVMMSPGHEVSFGFLKNSAIDQHINTRHREKDLDPVVEKHPDLLGIGIDESTAIVVLGDRFSVIGAGQIYVHEAGKKFYTLSHGQAFELRNRKPILQ